MKAYYGEAFPYMRKYFDLVWEQIRDQKLHQFCEGVNHNYITDKFAKKAYSLFAEAKKAVRGNKELERRIADQKLLLLFTDLNERNRINEKFRDIDEYAKKLAEFTRLVRERKITVIARRTTTQEWLQKTALFKVKNIWDPIVEKLIKKPVYTLKNSIPRVQRKTDNGWKISGGDLFGGEGPKVYSYRCPSRKCMVIRRPWFEPKHKAFTYLFLDEKPDGAWTLELEGQDNGKNDSSIKITVNEKEIFKGSSNYGRGKWTRRSFKVPEGILVRGKNKITIENLTPEKVKDKSEVKYITRKSRFWGWFIISDLKLRKNSE